MENHFRSESDAYTIYLRRYLQNILRGAGIVKKVSLEFGGIREVTIGYKDTSGKPVPVTKPLIISARKLN